MVYRCDSPLCLFPLVVSTFGPLIKLPFPNFLPDLSGTNYLDMTLLRRAVKKVAIEPELEPVYIGKDGVVRTATAEDRDNDGGDLITAEKDMLPVAWDSELRTWGFWSMAGYVSIS